MKICQFCGKVFDPVNERSSHPARYCSRECSHKAQTTRVTLVCRQCGKQFQRKAYMEKWSRERGPFCSFRCYGHWQEENLCGDNNTNYQNQSSRRGASQLVRNRKKVLQRDDYKCVLCGSTSRLHVHHKIGWQPHQINPHELDNLETLCASCHRKLHPVPHGPDGRFLSIH